MTNSEYAADQAADEIVDALLSGKMYPTEIDKLTYDAVFSRLRVHCPSLRPRVFLYRGAATVQFSGLSPATFVVSSASSLTRESFSSECIVKQGAQPLMWWPKAAVLDIALLKWSLLPICGVGAFLLAIQTTEDLHGYFALMTTVLAVVFTLYVVLRRSLRSQDEQEWLTTADGALDRTYKAERVIGATAVGTIVICLLEFLLTSSSTIRWDESHLLLVAGMPVGLIRWLSVFMGVIHLTLLASFFRSIVFYYPDREFGLTLLYVRDRWFAEQHAKASKAIEVAEPVPSHHEHTT